jgi:carbon storage regulator
MLVLTRKGGEQVVVPSCELTVTVLGIEGNKVRLGFTAPEEVGVFRQEVLQRLRNGSVSPEGGKFNDYNS